MSKALPFHEDEAPQSESVDECAQNVHRQVFQRDHYLKSDTVKIFEIIRMPWRPELHFQCVVQV